MMRNIPATLALLLLPALPLAAKPTALPPPVIPACVGVNIHFVGQPQKDLDGLASVGFGWIRMDFAWGSIEKTKGVYDFTEYDSLLAGLTARHIRPLFILDYGNDLYEHDSPSTPEARAAFARFAAAAAAHYRGKTILWEIWNEPNGGFWSPGPNVAAYGALALAAAHAIHAADPNATVIAPGSSGIPLDFLESLFRQGLLQEIDAVSLHPYRDDNPETAATDYQAVRRLIHQYEPPGKDIPLISSEWGYTTTNISEERQAQYLAREWLSNIAQGIRLSIWYDWHDDGTDPKNGEHNFGTVHFDYAPKPAYLAARTLIHALVGCRFVKRIPLASPDDYLLLFSRGPRDVRLAAWTSGDAHPLLLPITQAASLTTMLGDAAPLALAQGRLRLDVSPSPVYLNVTGDAALREAAAWTAAPVHPIYDAGQPLALSLTYRNPDTVPHRVQFVTLLTTAQGQRTALPGGADIVAPGQTLTVGAESATFRRVSATARVGLRIDGALQPYPQDVTFEATDPLSLELWPENENHVIVQIKNLSGEPTNGTLTSGGGHPALKIAVHLAAGQTSLEVPVEQSGPCSWSLRDTHGLSLASVPAEDFVPYLLPEGPLQPVLDGDLKVPSSAQCARTAEGEQVHYVFAPGWSFWRELEADPAPLDGKPLAYGVWINGDDSGNQINIRYQDQTGQTFQVNGPRLDWTGWRFLSFSLLADHGGNHWGGANNGEIHYPIQMNTLLLIDSVANARRHQGTITWKSPTIMYDRSPVPDQAP